MSANSTGILREQFRLVTEDYLRLDDLLDDSEKRYRFLSENANCVVFLADTQGRITYVCGSLERLLGYRSGTGHAHIQTPAWHQTAVQKLISIAETNGEESAGVKARVEHQLRREDGSMAWIEVSVSLVRDAEGRVRGAMGNCYDISERKRAEVALRASEERFRRVYEDSPIGIMLYDVSGKALGINKACARMFGMAGGTTASCRSIFDDPNVGDKLKARLRRGETVRWEEPIDLDAARKGGWDDAGRSGTVYVSIAMAALSPGADGVPSGYMAQIEDITVRKQAEAELEKAHGQEKERSRLLSGLLHELKTPVTTMMVGSGLLALDLPEGPMRRVAKTLQRSTENMNRRIDDFLLLARSSLGLIQLNLTTISPLPLLRDAVDYMEPVVSSRGQLVILDMPDQLCPVQADSVRLHVVMRHLIDNASRLTPEGGRITLRARQNGEGLIVEVEDTGPGIDEAEQERLFQTHGKPTNDRLGIGLALSNALVRLHGGRIWAKSQKGKGSTFCFSLPVQAN
ncbi:MAG: PAS domain-containing sensor histidine kinase [Chloroflexi bacterium]|nr:PAS domain-containing sensor histidine kinase [Chloroflexota bacterium]